MRSVRAARDREAAFGVGDLALAVGMAGAAEARRARIEVVLRGVGVPHGRELFGVRAIVAAAAVHVGALG
jgi:hypothetical protein